MQFHIFDQYEFGDGSSEQACVIAVASSQKFSSAQDFALATNGSGHFAKKCVGKLTGDPMKIDKLDCKSLVCSLCFDKLGIVLLGNDEAFILENDWNFMDAIVGHNYKYIRCQWSTTA